MIKQKKILFALLSIFLAFFIILKLFDYFLQKKYGLGTPLIYQNSKLNGYNIKPNQDIKRRGKNIRINDYGMRSNNDLEKSKDKKIIFFGDSVTFGGSIVNNDDLFSEKVCRKLNVSDDEYFCGNLAVNGFNVYSIIRSIKYKSFNSESLIIVTLISNNFVRTYHNVISQPFWSKKIDNLFPALTEVAFILIDKYRVLIKYNLGKEENFRKLDLKYYNDLIIELKNTLIVNNKPYIIFYSPSVEELSSKNENYFKKILKNNFKNFHDLSDIKYSNKKELYYDNIHINKKGHEIYSEFILDKVKKTLER